MTQVSRSFSVDAPPEVVLPYLADFSHAEEWDPGTVSCVRQGSGPVAVGAQWRNTSKIAGMSSELTYTLRELTADQVVLVGVNKTATSTETIRVTPEGAGSRIVYRNDTVFNGLAKLATPVVRLVFEKIASDVVSELSGALNRLASGAAGAR